MYIDADNIQISLPKKRIDALLLWNVKKKTKEIYAIIDELYSFICTSKVDQLALYEINALNFFLNLGRPFKVHLIFKCKVNGI